MIRYRYVDPVKPPAPFVVLTATNPDTGKAAVSRPAQIDTGADRTVFPRVLVEE